MRYVTEELVDEIKVTDLKIGRLFRDLWVGSTQPYVSLEMGEGDARFLRGMFQRKELQEHFKTQEGLHPPWLARKVEGGGCEPRIAGGPWELGTAFG